MAEKKKSNGGKVGGATAAVVAVALLLFGSNGGFGLFGGGQGTGDVSGTGIVSEAPGTEESASTSASESTADISVPEQTTGVVTVTIQQDKVSVNGEACQTPEELKALIEKLNTDDRTFELVEDQSILATHEWVLKVFEELKITLVTVEQ